MALTTDQRADRLRDRALGMLHRGIVWAGDGLRDLLRATLYEFARVEGRAEDALREADPSQTSELLPEWERVYSLPDACGTLGTEAARRGALLARIVDTGEASIGTVESVVEAYPGVEFGGITYDEPFTCESTCEDAVWDDAVFNTPTIKLFEGTGLASFDFDPVKCGLGRLSVSYSREETGPLFTEILSNAFSGYSSAHAATGSDVDSWTNTNSPTSSAPDFTAVGAARPTVSVVDGQERYASTAGVTLMTSTDWTVHASEDTKLAILVCAVSAEGTVGPLIARGSNGADLCWSIATDGAGGMVARNVDASGTAETAPIPYVPGQVHVWALRHFRGTLSLMRDGDASLYASTSSGDTDTATTGTGDLDIGDFTGYWQALLVLGVGCAMFSEAVIVEESLALLATYSGPAPAADAIATEAGDVLTTEAGDALIWES